MFNLNEIAIGNNHFNEIQPDALCKGGNMEGLTLGSNNLQSAIPLFLACFKNLMHVSI